MTTSFWSGPVTGTGEGRADAESVAEGEGEADGAGADGEGGADDEAGEAVAGTDAVCAGSALRPSSPGEQPTRISTPAAHIIAALRASTLHPRVPTVGQSS
ncbi:hypothetical protein [Streptomyces sp. NBC_00199]|uniref:hypothetical protein n=1 Tax=Streptomyces sp. NBC_00199 TaxID=2975678 RepID=UPI002250D3FF|nr:hypothetical protein [Streptomyces sp. NBC_00199]MCX5264503.1 hypothetical protein [Streptomyces sp. NBC_00199]